MSICTRIENSPGSAITLEPRNYGTSRGGGDRGRPEVQHFGHATRFHVYDVDRSGIVLVGAREDPGSAAAAEESAVAHQRKLELIRDCGALIVARVGPNALRLIEAQGIAVYESQDPAPDALKELAAAEGFGPSPDHGTGSP